MKNYLIFCVFITVASSNAFADRLLMPKAVLIKAGFRSFDKSRSIMPYLLRSMITPISSEDNYIENGLKWPIEFLRSEEMFIGNMHQYQTFSKPAYYHAGVDILAYENQKVYTPVTGIIEGGYYSYDDSPEGKTEKYFLPLKEALNNEADIPWGKKYFEVAIIDKFGNRFEFHHINAETLPEDIFNKIMSGSQKVSAGEHIGNVIDIGSKRKRIDMTHVHYNIINTHEQYINPFALSEKVKDFNAPVIKGVYAVKKAFCYRAPELIPFEDEALSTEKYIVINAVDYMTSKKLEKAPAIVRAIFNNGEIFEWNFTKKIVNSSGQRPDIRDVYLNEHCNMKVKYEMRASRSFDFYFKIPIPENYSGQVRLSVFDQNMNFTEKVISILN